MKDKRKSTGGMPGLACVHFIASFLDPYPLSDVTAAREFDEGGASTVGWMWLQEQVRARACGRPWLLLTDGVADSHLGALPHR